MSIRTDYENQARVFPRNVFFTGAGALVEGQGLCYDRNRGTAADVDYRRDKHVELPTVTNNMRFAGVTSAAYTADAAGQWIVIYEPGSVCNVAVGVDTTVDVTIMTCSNGAGDQGRFTQQGMYGRGTALALQTTTGQKESAFGVAAALDTTALILTDGNATFTTNSVAVGDTVVIFAGENDGTDTVTIGAFEVSSITSETVLVLTAAAGSTGGTMEVSYYIYADNPVCEALLLGGRGGEESGLLQWVSPVSAAATDPVMMVGGTTYMAGGVTIGTDTTSTIADGVINGQKKAMKLFGALTTQDWLVTVTSGLQRDGTTTLASLEFDGDLDHAVLEWFENQWSVNKLSGAAQA